MRTDLKINYASLEALSKQIGSYYDALDNIGDSLEDLKTVLEEQKSEAAYELLGNISATSYNADDKKNTLKQLKQLLDKYVEDMKALLKPIKKNEIVHADQCDVWYNVKQIEGPIKDIKQNAAVECSGNYYTVPTVEDIEEKVKREKEERNYKKLEEFRQSDLVEFANKVNKKLEKIWDIYDKNVKPFEETDDAYRKRLNKLYDACTDTGDKILDGLSFVGSVSFTFLTTLGGILIGAWVLAHLPAALAVGLIVAPIVGCIVLASVPEEYVPNWLKDEKHKDDEIIKTIKEGPVAIVEAIGQGLADTVQTPEGIASVTATVVGLVLVFRDIKKKKTNLDEEAGGVNKAALEAEGGRKTISFTDYDNIYQRSIHNAGKDKVMLGKYDGGGATSYITKAGDDYTYFSLGSEWDTIKAKYGYTDDDMFKLFNEAFLDDGINAGKIFQFSHNPINDTGALGQEYQYLLKNNYKWDAGTMTMKPKY